MTLEGTKTMADNTITLPAVQPEAEATIAEWAAARPDWQQQLYSAGAILFRGFGVDSVDAFESALAALTKPVAEFQEETSPRSSVGQLAFTSTDYPAPYPIQFHNEFSYRRRWPHRLLFCCLTPPASDGATLIADSRRVLQRLPAPLRQRFEREGIQYTRNFTGLGIPWEKAFGTHDKSQVERYCRAEDIEFHWSAAGLHTRQHRSGIEIHPVTGEKVWFNHALILSVHGTEPAEIRETLRSLPQDQIPTNSSYGSGEPIEADVIEQIRAAYADESIRFDWQTGDVLLIDNLLMAHAREPFTGSRKIIVGMGDT